PTVSINNPALESRVNLARRGLNDCRSERLEEIAVDRSNAKLEAGQIGIRDRFVEIEMEWIAVDVPGEENRIYLLGIELRHIVVTAVLAQFRHRPFGQLPGVGLRHHVG